MSIVDQIIEEEEGGDEIGAGGWVNVATSLAAHEAMTSGFKKKSALDPSETISRVDFSEVGVIDVQKSLKLSKSYIDVLTKDQTVDARLRPTADDVVDGGMKRGSKVVIEIVPENAKYATWDKAVKAKLLKEGFSLTFTDFSVQSIAEPDSERYTLHETYGADIIQTFGARARVYSLSGQIVNGRLDITRGGETRSMDWKNAFQRYYERYFSAHACVRNRNKARIYFHDTVIEGYAVAIVPVTVAESQSISAITLSFVVSDRYWPRENDRNIAGYYKTNGFRLTGASVPDEFFPQAQLELYFQKNPANILIKQIENKKVDILTLCRDIAKLDGSITADLIKTRSQDTSLYGVKVYGEGFQLHKFLVDTSALEKSILDIIEEEKDIKSRIRTYNKSNSNIDLSDEIIITGTAEESQLREDLSKIRLRKRGLYVRVQELNNRCARLESNQRDLSALLAAK